MYEILKCDLDVLKSHSVILDRLRPCHFLAADSPSPSRDKLFRLFFENTSSGINRPFLIMEEGTRKIAGLLFLHKYRLDSNDMFVHLISLDGVEVDRKEISAALQQFLLGIINKNKLTAIRSLIMPFEKDHEIILVAAGFESEGCLGENAYFDGKYEDVFVFRLSKTKDAV